MPYIGPTPAQAPTAAWDARYLQIATAATTYAPMGSGTITAFQQTTAPTGWTKVTTYNDAGFRVVSGTASAVTGATAFSTVFAQTTTGTMTPATTGGPSTNTSDGPSTNTTDGHTLNSAEIPAHTHQTNIAGGAGSPAAYYYGRKPMGRCAVDCHGRWYRRRRRAHPHDGQPHPHHGKPYAHVRGPHAQRRSQP